MSTESSLGKNKFETLFMEYRITTIRGWFVEQGKSMPLLLLSRKEPLKCATFSKFVNGEMYKTISCPLFVAVIFKGHCVNMHVFQRMAKQLDDSTKKQTCPQYVFSTSCFDFTNNLLKHKENEFIKKNFLKDSNDIVEDEISDTLPENVKFASHLITTIRSHFKPKHGYEFRYGELSHAWDHDENLLSFTDLMHLLSYAKTVLLNDQNVVRIQPPCYVVGDLHGNYRDVSALGKLFGLIPGINVCTCKYLFLGDYVDRGSHQIELIVSMLCLKIISPDTIYMLRGNHESAIVNGNIRGYGEMSFMAQCMRYYGRRDGYYLWVEFNNVFQCMPFCAVVDSKLFCVHGGIAKSLCSEHTNALEKIDLIERPCECKDAMVNDMLWSDPADSSEEMALQLNPNEQGFGPNQRGKGAYVFGQVAVQNFMKNSGCRYIIRAHQSEEMGIGLRQNKKVVTVFSSSHYCGLSNSAAGLLVNNGLLTAIAITGKDYVRVKKEGQTTWDYSGTETQSEFFIN
ncbi:Serine/threonine-protein phosphatase [Entamoeba marina]